MVNDFDIQRYFKEGWELFSANVANLVVATIIYAVVIFAANFIPLAPLLVSGPMIGGFYYIILDADKNTSFNIMRIFDGFKLKLVPLALIGILTTVFTFSGFVLLILPGFLVIGWYLFSFLFAIDEDLDFWPAMEASRKIGFENHISVFVFAISLIVLNFFGALALGIGLLVTVPLSMCVVTKAFLDQRRGKESASALAPPPPPPPTV
ncbi:hypothetical protein MNBD_NITROSPINAE02-1805 [hydrothermal vent metagenome]|uniref:Transmembrane protein n=1 Tax=hydrothermal vent metagenome TaxID=652676 RepID=A0A3B1CX19_9ZZZZ